MNIIRKTTPWFPSLFDEFFTRDFGIDLAPKNYQTPAVNISEKEDAFHLELVAPGKEKKDFGVVLEQDTLTISTTSGNEIVEDDTQFTRREFDYASFNRSFRVPKTIDTKNIKANYKNGLLTIVLHKRKEAIPEPKKQIEIR
jgi:HSP20 family protein